jgi:hypothetical protein
VTGEVGAVLFVVIHRDGPLYYGVCCRRCHHCYRPLHHCRRRLRHDQEDACRQQHVMHATMVAVPMFPGIPV